MEKIPGLAWWWELPQNLLGAALYLYLKSTGAITRTQRVDGVLVSWITRNLGISLGKWIFLPARHLGTEFETSSVKHELGHCVQSRWLGPLYLLVIGIPSMSVNIWDRRRHKDWTREQRVAWYYRQPTEKSADKLGGVVR